VQGEENFNQNKLAGYDLSFAARVLKHQKRQVSSIRTSGKRRNIGWRKLVHSTCTVARGGKSTYGAMALKPINYEIPASYGRGRKG